MNCKIRRFFIGENMRISISYENMKNELIFIGECKTKINNVVNWYQFNEKTLDINKDITNDINFHNMLLEMRDDMKGKVELLETLTHAFDNIDEIDVEENVPKTE